MKPLILFLFLALFLSKINIFAQAPSPKLYLNFNNNLQDQSGNQGSINAYDYSYASSECDSGIYVNGSRNSPYSYVEVLDNGTLEPARTLTLAAWASYEDSTGGSVYGYIASKRYSYTAVPYDSYCIYVDNSSLGLKKWTASIGNLSGINVVTSVDTASFGVWTHVAMTFNGSQLSVYVNGQLQNTTTIAAEDIIYSNLPFYVGTARPDAGNTQFKGKIDEVYFYDTVLTVAQIQELASCTPITTSVISENESEISIYPNPANSQLFISGLNEELIENLEIYNNLGQLVQSRNNINSSTGIDISTLTDGFYYINIRSSGNKIAKKRLQVIR